MNLFSEIVQAQKRIQAHILKTPLYLSDYLSGLSGGNVYLKLENEQYTGSFKARGALNKILATSPEERKTGFITASTGNHAQGFARALSIAGATGTIFLPENASPAKVAALQSYPVTLEFYGYNSLETELHAKSIAAERGLIWVSPYNDPRIIAGQGTMGMEIYEQAAEEIDAILGCIGGGGMMAGVATAIKNLSPQTTTVGCLPEKSPEMYLSVQAGEVVSIEFEETLSDGSAGGLEVDSITFPICQQYVDKYTLVSEKEIADSIRLIAEKHHKIIEGAAAVVVASFLKNLELYRNKTVVLIICGANISMEKFKAIL
ncbi:MAG: threonine/serine dehydratase [Bacteroidota bacterium]